MDYILRVDEVCDTNLSGYIDTGEETWRTIEVNTHKPGSLGALIGKRVYQYSTRATTTPSSTNDYTYTYDAVGNVQVVYKASGTVGQEAYFFAQDAFGNELSGDTATPASNRTNLLSGASWTTARTAGITEHQTGKIQSSFTGLYYFSARWYDPVVGRFVGRDPRQSSGSEIYGISSGNPVNYPDPLGMCATCGYQPSWYISDPVYTPTPQPAPFKTIPTPPWNTPPTPRPKPMPECRNGTGSGYDFFSWGNWCGAGGDEWDSPDRLIWYLEKCLPVDELDNCCFNHDICYFIHGINFDVPMDLLDCSERTKKQKQCDKNLCDCSKQRSWNGNNSYKSRLEYLFCTCPCTYHGESYQHWGGLYY